MAIILDGAVATTITTSLPLATIVIIQQFSGNASTNASIEDSEYELVYNWAPFFLGLKTLAFAFFVLLPMAGACYYFCLRGMEGHKELEQHASEPRNIEMELESLAGRGMDS